MIITSFEDRETHLIGLQVLVCSLARYLPDIPVHIACPIADDNLRAWLKSYPRVILDDDPRMQGLGWDAKPTLLLRHLDAGHDTVLWMDSDIVVTREFRNLLPPTDVLVMAEERALTRYGVRQRLSGWQFPVGRTLGGLNSCVVRARQVHRPLIRAWQNLLQHPDYQNARTLPFARRPAHLLGDQDVLQALLGSPQFAQVDLCVLRSGHALIQFQGVAGYAPLQRLAHLFRGMPPLIHCQGDKPWIFPRIPSFRTQTEAFLSCVFLEGSPYAHFARRYRSEIPGFPSSLEIRTLPGRISNTVSCGVPSLRGITQSAVMMYWRRAADGAAFIGKARRRLARETATAFKRLGAR